MKDLKYCNVDSRTQVESLFMNQNHSLCRNVETKINGICEKNMKTRKKLTNNARDHRKQPSILFHLYNYGSSRNKMQVTTYISMPQITRGNKIKKKPKLRTKSCNGIPCNKNMPHSTKYVVSEHHFKRFSNGSSIPIQTNFKVYRCQMAPGVTDGCQKCCCGCNSDVLFEVMKDLYDCYKSRDCDNCNCILCCNLPEHERDALAKKSAPSIGLESAFKELAMKGFALPEGKSESEKMLIDRVRYNLGLPPEPKTDAMRNIYTNAANAGLLLPLENKSPPEKEKILKGLANMGIPLPEGRTASEKALIAKIKAGTGTPLTVLSPSEKMRKAKSAGLLTPFEGKSPDRIEKILRGLAMRGIPLPEGKTPSKKKLIKKVRADLGLPPEPKTSAMRDKHLKAAKIGLLVPLEGKTHAQKEKILHGLRNMGIPLPVGRTPSEKALISKVKSEFRVPPITSSEKMRILKAGGLRTPLDGKTPAQKEAILKEMAMKGIPLPDGKTESDKNLINKIRLDLGLPPTPKTPSMKEKHIKAAETGLLLPLEGKSPKEKERILRGLADMRIPLPKGRTPSEKALIAKIKLEAREPLISPEKMRKAKASGLLTPLEGKTLEQKEKIFKGLAMHGIPLPPGKTKSERLLLNKIRLELGLPPEPKSPSMKEKHIRAADAGLLLPLEGKSPKEKEKILQGYFDNGIPLPEGRTPSEKALIAKIKPKAKEATECQCEVGLKPSDSSEKVKKAAAGLMTPLEGKPIKEKERILRNIAKAGLPLPAGKSPSEVELINQIKKEFGIREESPGEKIRKAKAAGFLSPLEGKTPEQREMILRGRAAAGLPLPEGTSPSERELIKQIKASTGYVTPSPSERLRKAEAAGLLSPLKGKTPSRKELILRDMIAAGVPIPEGTTPSEKEIIKKLTSSPAESSKSKRLRAAKAAGFLTPLAGKTPERKEKILRGLAIMGLPLPKPNTPSESSLIDRIRLELGLPPEPKSRSLREKYEKAHDAGIILPLEGKSPKSKERILKGLQSAGIPLPIGRTRSEKDLVKRIKAGISAGHKIPFDKMPLEEKIIRLKHLVKTGRPLPDAKTPSAKELVEKVRKVMGLPPGPKTESMKLKMRKAHEAGLITPLEGKNELQKRKILSRLAKAGIPLPEGRSPSEKALIRRILAKYRKRPPAQASVGLPSDMLVKAKEQGLLTPLKGKTPEEKERILRGLAAQGLPLPEATTPSDKLLTDKIRKELGLPPEPTTPSMKERHNKAAVAGKLVPLEGLDTSNKVKNLQALADMGIPLPEGRTQSEKDIIKKINVGTSPDMKMKEAEAAGLLTPLTDKSLAEKERILRGLAESGLPLPKGVTRSERYLIKKIKAEYGIPPHEVSSSQRDIIRKAKARGLFTPLSGKKTAEKERIIRGLAEAGLPLPEGKTATEKDIIRRVKDDLNMLSTVTEEFKGSKSTCERACGCGKKKIKFKHSYVKISIISPDMSNLCPCPVECLQGVKPMLYAGNTGINVVVERAIGVPQYSRPASRTVLKYKKIKSKHDFRQKSTMTIKIIFDEKRDNETFGNMLYEPRHFERDYVSDYSKCIVDSPLLHTYSSIDTSTKCHCEYAKADRHSYTRIADRNGSESTEFFDIYSEYISATSSNRNSSDSIFYIKSQTSLSCSSSCELIHSSGIILCADRSTSSNDTVKQQGFLINRDGYYTVDNIARSRYEYMIKSTISPGTKQKQIIQTTNKRDGDDDFQVFQMSRKTQNYLSAQNSTNEPLANAGQPVVVLNQLSSEIDVTAVVDEILTKKEFREASSLFVVVPISDDEDDQVQFATPKDAPTCFHLSKNYNKWNCTDEEELCLPHRRETPNVSGLRVSAKGRKFFLEGVPGAAVRPNNKDTTFTRDGSKKKRDAVEKLCLNNAPDSVAKGNGISTDTTQDRPCCCARGQIEATDSTDSYNDRYAINIVSEVIKPLLSHQGINSETMLTQGATTGAEAERRPSSVHASVTSVSVCRIPPCVAAKSPRTLHFSDSVEYSPDFCPEEIPESLSEIKKLLEKQSPETIKELCDQLLTNMGANSKNVGTGGVIKKSPTRAPRMLVPPGYKQVGYIPAGQLPAGIRVPCPMPPGAAVTLPGPPAAPLSAKDEICPTCFKPKYKDGVEMKCACSGKKKSVRLRPLCPCEQHQWPMSKILFGPNPGTRSVGDQCCLCDDSPLIGPDGRVIHRLGRTAPLGPLVDTGMQYGPGSIITPKGYRFRPKSQPVAHLPVPLGYYGQPNLDSEMGQIEIYGPAGGYAILAPGGTYTQAGIRQTRYSTGAGTDTGNVGVESSTVKKKNCVCSDKKGKKKNKVICMCPPEPEPDKPVIVVPVPEEEPAEEGLPDGLPDLDEIEPDPSSLHYLEYYGDYLKNKIESHRRKMQQMKSDLTQTTSGFKFNKKKRPRSEMVDSGSEDTDVSVEDAIRYYALTNPDLLRELLPPEIISSVSQRTKEDCACEEVKAVNTEKKVECECPEEPLTEEQKAARALAAAVVAGVGVTGAEAERADEATPPPEELPKGFKIRMPGKGSGSKGLTGICCFDLIEQR